MLISKRSVVILSSSPLQFRYIPYITQEVYFLQYSMRNLPYLESPDGMCIYIAEVRALQSCRIADMKSLCIAG